MRSAFQLEVTAIDIGVDARSVLRSYTRSLVWTAILIPAFAWAMTGVGLAGKFWADGGAESFGAHASALILLMPVLVGLVAWIATILVFPLPHYVEAVLVILASRRYGRSGGLAVFAALPLTAILTWYCYDYLTPSDMLPLVPVSATFQHGISPVRYAMALGAQAPVTLFGLFFWDAGARAKSTRPIVMTALALAVLVGGAVGHYR